MRLEYNLQKKKCVLRYRIRCEIIWCVLETKIIWPVQSKKSMWKQELAEEVSKKQITKGSWDRSE